MLLKEYLNVATTICEERNLEIEAIKKLLIELKYQSAANLILSMNDELDESLISIINQYLEKRIPIQYILGYTYFYGMKIKVNKKNENYKAINGSLYSKDGTYLVRYAGEKDAESFAIPAGVTSINSLAFSYSAKTVTLPSSLETIGTVFSGLQELEIIIFEQGCQIKELGYDAFHGCSNLKTITIPASVTNISWYAFFDCTALESVYFEENSQLIEIGPYAFMNCTSLRSITIPEGTTNIGYCAFSDCSALEEVTIPASVSTIEQVAFKDCTNLKNVKMSSPKWSLSKKEESAAIFQNTTSDTEEIWAKYLTEDFVDFCWRKSN